MIAQILHSGLNPIMKIKNRLCSKDERGCYHEVVSFWGGQKLYMLMAVVIGVTE